MGKPLIAIIHPAEEMTSGILRYTEYLCKVFNDSMKIIDSSVETKRRNKDYADHDYTIIGGVTDPGKDLCYLDNLPKPILLVIHDILHYPYIGEEIHKKVDGYIVSMEETKDFILSKNKKANVLLIKQPFVSTNGKLDLSKKKNQVISVGRIVPERGHRHAAELAGLGYKVVIAGSKVSHHEYGLYYNRVEKYGATMKPNVTDAQMQKLLESSKILMSFCYTHEQYPSVYYSLLEPIDFGCIPVVPSWVAKSCKENKLSVMEAECSANAARRIDDIFRNWDLFEVMTRSNKELVRHWSDDFVDIVNSFAERFGK